MTETTVDYPSVENLAVGWVRQTSTLTTILGAHPTPGTRCATRFPSDPTMPFLRVFTVYAGPLHLGEEVVSALLQWDAVASRGAAAPDYATAEALGLALIKAARDASGTIVSGQGVIQQINYRSMRRIEEPDLGWARYTIETQMIARAFPPGD